MRKRKLKRHDQRSLFRVRFVTPGCREWRGITEKQQIIPCVDRAAEFDA
jgi:hypothetical protein